MPTQLWEDCSLYRNCGSSHSQHEKSVWEKKDRNSAKRTFCHLTHADLDYFTRYHLREEARNRVTQFLLWSANLELLRRLRAPWGNCWWARCGQPLLGSLGTVLLHRAGQISLILHTIILFYWIILHLANIYKHELFKIHHSLRFCNLTWTIQCYSEHFQTSVNLKVFLVNFSVYPALFNVYSYAHRQWYI